jgi:hypothetical protein
VRLPGRWSSGRLLGGRLPFGENAIAEKAFDEQPIAFPLAIGWTGLALIVSGIGGPVNVVGGALILVALGVLPFGVYWVVVRARTVLECPHCGAFDTKSDSPFNTHLFPDTMAVVTCGKCGYEIEVDKYSLPSRLLRQAPVSWLVRLVGLGGIVLITIGSLTSVWPTAQRFVVLSVAALGLYLLTARHFLLLLAVGILAGLLLLVLLSGSRVATPITQFTLVAGAIFLTGGSVLALWHSRHRN